MGDWESRLKQLTDRRRGIFFKAKDMRAKGGFVGNGRERGELSKEMVDKVLERTLISLI